MAVAGVNSSLAPLLRERARRLLRRRGWPRSLALRRALAVALALLAVVLALHPAGAAGTASRWIVVAARDLAPGTTLRPADVALRALPPAAVPGGAQSERSSVTGHVLVSAARSGEPITDARLVGRANATLSGAAADAVSVGVRLADPAVAELLRPGAHVDVVAAAPEVVGNGATEPPDSVLAVDAVVVTVRRVGSAQPGDEQRDRMVVLALPRDTATRVAASALRQPVTVTLRQN
ncbi:MAG: SAF domain-containing protein [Sciscionella sp.]